MIECDPSGSEWVAVGHIVLSITRANQEVQQNLPSGAL
jgi:hypothetical protein